MLWIRGGQDSADDGHARRASADDGGGVLWVYAADGKAGDVQLGGQVLNEGQTLRGLAWVGACGKDGSGDEVVGAIALGLQRTFVVMNGASNEHIFADEGAGVPGAQGLFAEVYAVGVGEEGYVNTFVDDEQGFVVNGLSDIHRKFEELAAGEILFTKLHDVYTAFDGEGDLLGEGHVVAEAAIRYEAESREGQSGHLIWICDGLRNFLSGAAG